MRILNYDLNKTVMDMVYQICKFQLNDDQVYNNIMNYGNTTAASVIIALTEAWEKGKINDGDLGVLAAFGSGFTWGSVMVRW